MRLGRDAGLLAACGTRCARLQLGSFEGVPAAMGAERTRSQGVGLFRLLHPLAHMAVVFVLDEARIAGRLRAHAACNACGWNSSGLSRSPIARPITSGWRSMPRWNGCTLRMVGAVRLPIVTSSTRPCSEVMGP